MARQATEEFSGSEDDWEVEEVDDGMVAYAWKSKDELLLQAARVCCTYCRSILSGIRKAQWALP